MKIALAIFLVVTGCVSQPPVHGLVELRIDRKAISPHPFLKTKLGVARASGLLELTSTFPAMAEIGTRAFCTTIAFDDVTDRNRANYALGSSIFTFTGASIDSNAMKWLADLQQGVTKLRLSTYVGLVGAPKPYQIPVIRKPAAHPTPTSISGAAKLTGDWARQTFRGLPNVNWVIWNEPEHTLKGINSLEAAGDMAAIYRSYVQVLDPLTSREGLGLAAFMKASLRPSSNDRANTFFQNVISQLRNSGDPRIDYITMNNYHGKAFELFNALDSELSKRGMDQPLIFTQFAPAAIGEQPSLAGTNDAASLYINQLNQFVETPGLGVGCFSFWAGPEHKALIRISTPTGIPSKSPAFEAIAFYQRMPLWRLAIPALPATSDLVVWGGVQDDQLGILISYKHIASVAVEGINYGSKILKNRQLDGKQGGGREPNGARKVDRITGRKTLRKAERVAERGPAGQSSSSGRADLTSLDLNQDGETITFVLPGLAGESFNLERLRSGQTGVYKERVTVDAKERLTIRLVRKDILLLINEKKAAKRTPLRVLRQDLYIHRRGPSGQPLKSNQQGISSMDPLQDGFVLAVPGPAATAHASAIFALPRPIVSLQWAVPPGSDRRAAQKCSAALVQYLKGDQVVGNGAWGSKEVVQRLMRSRAFPAVAGKVSYLAPQPWPGAGEKSTLLKLTSLPGVDAVRLHMGMGGCAEAQQVQVVPQE